MLSVPPFDENAQLQQALVLSLRLQEAQGHALGPAYLVQLYGLPGTVDPGAVLGRHKSAEASLHWRSALSSSARKANGPAQCLSQWRPLFASVPPQLVETPAHRLPGANVSFEDAWRSLLCCLAISRVLLGTVPFCSESTNCTGVHPERYARSADHTAFSCGVSWNRRSRPAVSYEKPCFCSGILNSIVVIILEKLKRPGRGAFEQLPLAVALSPPRMREPTQVNQSIPVSLGALCVDQALLGPFWSPQSHIPWRIAWHRDWDCLAANPCVQMRNTLAVRYGMLRPP